MNPIPVVAILEYLAECSHPDVPVPHADTGTLDAQICQPRSFNCYPVVIVPSALTRMDTPGRGVWAGPCTTLKLLAGSKMALCAGQTSC